MFCKLRDTMLKQIGKFTISERIGRGAHSRVYRAVDQQGRPVAIKVATAQTEPEHLDEFQRDLVAAASVLHPNLVAVHDLGFEDEFPYLVMELVEGRDFDRILKSNPNVPLSERINAMLQVADALKSAHERGIFHLDVRPSKIMLGAGGDAKLLDLGLGRLCFDPARVTDHGYLIGSPFYMSPERLNAIDTADSHCDIWSFGVTFYELIAGKHPFYDDDGDRMIGNIMDAQPAPLTGVPASLSHVILRAIAKDPADRYQNFAELLADAKPVMGELQREESDALMAQALHQTDSGRWHEARRIARKLRDMDPQQPSASPLFNFSDEEPEEETVPAHQAAAASAARETPSMAPAVVTVALAEALETPEPAPPPVPEPPPKPPRPERTAPKIPVIGARNGSTTTENGAPPLAARVSPPPPANGAKAAAAPPPPAAKPPRPPVASPATAAPQPSVRLLEVSQSSGLPWGKMAGVAAAALVAIGLFYFFLRPPLRLVRAVDASEQSKTSGPSVRVIEPPNSDRQAAVPALSETVASPTPADAASITSPPRSFDPKSLALPKAPVRPRPVTMAALSAPSLGGNSESVADPAGLPIALNVPPPPAAPVKIVPPPQAAPPPTTAAAPAPAPAPQSLQAAQASALRVGGSFSEPALVHSVQPIYPPAAVQRKAQGVVRFQATIAKDGSVKNLQLVSGDPLLNVAAKQAVLQWKYRPATLNGEPVEVTQAIVVKFNLNH
jgi:TonB family protein